MKQASWYARCELVATAKDYESTELAAKTYTFHVARMRVFWSWGSHEMLSFSFVAFVSSLPRSMISGKKLGAFPSLVSAKSHPGARLQFWKA
jgi:hypothetical protein